MENPTKNNSSPAQSLSASPKNNSLCDPDEHQDLSSSDDTDWELYRDISVAEDASGDCRKDFPQPFPLNECPCDVPMHKYPFKLKQNDAGNILTVHHTIRSRDRELRVRIGTCCFNEMSNKLVVIDRRGNIYIFDFVCKRYWHLATKMPQATLLVPSPMHQSEYIVGNELSCLFTLNVETSVLRNSKVGDAAIQQISFGSRLQSYSACNTLIRCGNSAALLNLRTFQVSHQLEFDQSRFSLKFASFIPNTDQFFTCFTNDSIHLWSTCSLERLQIVQPIKARDLKLRLMRSPKSLPVIALREEDDEDGDLDDELEFKCEDQHFADGKLLAFCFTPNGNKFYLSTVDGYLLVLNTAGFDIDAMFKLRDFTLKQMVVLAQPKDRIVFAITNRGMAIMLDLLYTDIKLIIQRSNAVSVSVSRDGKLLSVLSRSGEVNVWSTCRLYNALHAQAHCISQVRAALCKPKLPSISSVSMCRELRHLLKRERLEAIIGEFGCYPEKYRFIIWSTLLELPSNAAQFQVLLKRGQPAAVRHRGLTLKMKSDSQRRAVIKVWSCMTHWCKVFGHVDFMPDLIYPFVKQMTKNSMVVFELLVSLLLNHMQLCFEFHPMPPGNYLAMCENILQVADPQLCRFYKAMDVKPKDFAWSLLINAFSEVLDEPQWLILWDNILTNPPYFIIFVIAAFNLLHREIIIRLPERSEVVAFFHEQNAVDVSQWLKRAKCLMTNCKKTIHPERFIGPFKPIPSGVYPMFLKYPRDWIEQQETQTVELIKQQKDIDTRLRKLELEELKMKERLEQGLKQEEHVRRVKEMEMLYQETMKREEERLASHRKVLLSYQLEMRQRKCQVLSQLQESEQRRRIMEMEKDIDALMRNVERERRRHNQEMLFVEDEIRNQDMELLEQCCTTISLEAPLSVKYFDSIKKIQCESDKLRDQMRQMTHEQSRTAGGEDTGQMRECTDIELSLIQIQREFSDIMNSDNSSK